MKDMKIAVLIPCYNEEKTIAKVVSDYKEVLKGANIYVYDNNSTDKSAKIAKKCGAIVRREPRQGKGNVIRSMFSEIDADCYLIVDGDDTYSPLDARKMCDLIIKDNYDMVIGDRLSSTYFKENKRLFHNTGNKVVREIINFLFKSKIHDVMTGYRAFSYAFVKTFPVLSQNFEIETEMTIHAVDKNMKICEIPIRYKDRPNGSVSKLHTIKDGIKILKTIARLFREYRPLRFCTILSFIFFVISVVFAIPVFSEYFKTGLVPRIPTLIFAGFMLIISLSLLICGIILGVVVKKHRQLFEYFLIKARSER